jgi:hypothetical protein
MKVAGCCCVRQCSEPKPQHQVNGVNAHHRPVLEQFAQNAERDAVVRVVERRDDDGGVADVEIRVARRQPTPSKYSGAGMGSATHSGLAPSSRRKSADALPIFRQRRN